MLPRGGEELERSKKEAALPQLLTAALEVPQALMNETVLGYIGFVVAALILAWAALVVGKRIGSYRRTPMEMSDRWIRMDPTQLSALEDIPSSEELEEELQENPDARAQQNGHYSNKSKRMF